MTLRPLWLLLVLGAAARAEPPATPAAPCALAAAHLHARLSGAVSEEIDWSPPLLECDGMPRADGGIRLRFTGPARGGPLVVVLGMPTLAAGASARAVPVNVTLIPEGRHVYGTRGTDKCVLDEVSQTALPPAGGNQQWQVAARGFCLEPARAVGGDDAILLTTFELTGLVTVEPDEGPAAPAEPATP